MIAEDLVTAVRTTAFLPTTDPLFTSAKILLEATDVLHTVCQRTVVAARSVGAGYWLKRKTFTTDGATKRYRIPYRAVGGTLASVSIGTTPNEARAPAYTIVGDVVVFDVAPSSGQSLHFDYHLRPSTLYASQTAGRVTAVNTTARTVTVNSVPNDQTGTPAAVTSSTLIDIVKPNGWHEVVVVGATQTLASTTFTFAAGTDLSDVEVGDYVRAAEQTDWPCLPDDFHRTLADATAQSILISKNATDKALVVEKKAAAAWERFRDIISPRVKNDSPVIKPTVGILRGRSRSRRYPRASGGFP